MLWCTFSTKVQSPHRPCPFGLPNSLSNPMLLAKWMERTRIVSKCRRSKQPCFAIAVHGVLMRTLSDSVHFHLPIRAPATVPSCSRHSLMQNYRAPQAAGLLIHRYDVREPARITRRPGAHKLHPNYTDTWIRMRTRWRSSLFRAPQVSHLCIPLPSYMNCAFATVLTSLRSENPAQPFIEACAGTEGLQMPAFGCISSVSGTNQTRT